MDPSIVIKTYTIADLEALLSDQNFWKLDPLPITKQRIVSQMRNPRASKEDLALLVAFDNGQVVAYTGGFPDRVYLNGSSQKACCMTTAWAHPSRRRQGIVSKMRAIMQEAYEGRLYVSEMSAAAFNGLVSNGNFTQLKPMKFHQLGIRFSVLDVLPGRLKHYKKLYPLYHGIETLANLPIKPRQFLWKAKNKMDEAYRVEYLAEIDKETALFIEKHQKNELIRRGAPELDWITRYPWVIQAPFPDVSTPKYFFSTVARSFCYIKYRIIDASGEIKAFVMLRLREGRLLVPYAYFEESDADIVGRFLCHQMIGLGVTKFETCNMLLINQIKKLNFPIASERSRDRNTVLSIGLAKGADLETIRLQDGDGDKVFS
jgi:hypothetical protein